MLKITDDLRIQEIKELISPETVGNEFPATESATGTVIASRAAIHNILHGKDDRLLVVIGPCSIHDPKAALDYADRLAALRKQHADTLEIVMRVYFEKPRTVVGWKGLINDPNLDGSFEINNGLRIARSLLVDINSRGLPAACEFLDMTTPQYIADLVSWAAIGARTTESQIHRELSSGLSCAVGFKNGTSGDVKIAVDAVKSASHPHHFLAVTKNGRSAIATTKGNNDCHIILRGGKTTNFDAQSVDDACAIADKAKIKPQVMIDSSHANSSKKPENQPAVIDDVATQVEAGDNRIFGVMVESNLVAGRQDLTPDATLTYGQSITDGCIDWESSVSVIERLADAVSVRRQGNAKNAAATSDMVADPA